MISTKKGISVTFPLLYNHALCACGLWEQYIAKGPTFQLNCDSKYQKVPVVGRLDFELQCQNVSKCGSKVNFEILCVSEFSMLTLQVAWLRYYIKAACSQKYKILNCYCALILCPYSKLQERFFSKSTFYQPVMASSMKLPYLKNIMSNIYFFCIKIELKEQPFRK